MQIGNPNYKTCPHCGAKEEYFPGPYFVNVYELTEWSDGVTFQELPSLEETELQQCYTCNQFYWFTHKGGGLPLEGYLKAAKYFEKEYSR